MDFFQKTFLLAHALFAPPQEGLTIAMQCNALPRFGLRILTPSPAPPRPEAKQRCPKYPWLPSCQKIPNSKNPEKIICPNSI